MPRTSADPAKVTAAALSLSRPARLRVVAALLDEEGDSEGAADYEAAARDAEMQEQPGKFAARGSHEAFVKKLRTDVLRRSRGLTKSTKVA
jgi:hypothetical protein